MSQSNKRSGKLNYALCPQFSGDPSESFERWQEDFYACVALYDWPLDKAYLIISSALRGRAKIYYSSLPEAVRIDSNELLVKLKEKYGLASQNVLTRLKGLERVMKPTETVQQFASALAEVFDKLQIKDEAQKVGTFVAGLPAAYKTSIVTMRPSSFEEAEQCALLLEGNVTTNFETTVIAALTSLTQSVEEVKNPTNTVLTAGVTPTEKYPENAQQNNARKQPQQREDQTQRQSFPNQPRQSGQRSSPYCGNCREPHLFGQHTQPQGYGRSFTNNSNQYRQQPNSQNYGYNPNTNRNQGYDQSNYQYGNRQQGPGGYNRNQAQWRPNDRRYNSPITNKHLN